MAVQTGGTRSLAGHREPARRPCRIPQLLSHRLKRYTPCGAGVFETAIDINFLEISKKPHSIYGLPLEEHCLTTQLQCILSPTCKRKYDFKLLPLKNRKTFHIQLYSAISSQNEVSMACLWKKPSHIPERAVSHFEVQCLKKYFLHTQTTSAQDHI
jgi:hypothetical protein